MTPMGGSNYGNSGMSAIKSMSFFLLFAGIVLITIGYVQSENLEKPPRVEYRYVPRSFEESQQISTPILSIFGSMFSNLGPWQKATGFMDTYPWQRQLISSRPVFPYNNPNSGLGRAVGQRIIT
jgi:hypothetical protein